MEQDEPPAHRNRPLEQDVEKSFAELQELAHLVEQVNAGLLLDEVLDHVFESFQALIPYDRIGCALVADDGRSARSVWNRSRASETKLGRGYSARLQGSSLEVILESGRPRILNDLEAYLKDHPDSQSTRRILAEGIRSSLTCPLIASGKPIGFLFFSSMKPHAYADAHIETYLRIAGQLSMTIEKGRIYQKLLATKEQLETRSKFIEHVFGRYLSDEVVQRLLNTPEGLELGGEERQVTLLMADLRGFSALVDELAPQQSVRLLNHYLESMTTVIMEHQGTINEFLGDCIFAMFGAPFSAGNEVRRAAACAISMQLAMERVNQTFREEGLPSLEIGIAVHTGTVVAGNVGCARRAKYGVVGTAVNLVSRLEGCARGGQVLISETALEQLGHEAALGPRFQVSVKGFRGALNACELIGLKGGPRIASVLSEEPAVWLRAPLPIRYRRVMGKQLGRVFGGAIVSVSPEQAEIRPTVPDSCPQCSAGSESSRAVVPLEPQDDVEVLLGEMHPWDSSLAVYAKATEVLGGENPGFRAVFTRIPPGARVLIDELVEQR